MKKAGLVIIIIVGILLVTAVILLFANKNAQEDKQNNSIETTPSTSDQNDERQGITITNREYRDEMVEIYFTPNLDLVLNELTILKNDIPINIVNLKIGNLDTFKIGNKYLATANYKNEDYIVYAGHPYLMGFEDSNGTTYGDTYIIKWGDKVNISVTIDPPIIEIKNAAFIDNGVTVTYMNNGGQGEMSAEAPIITMANNERIYCFYLATVNAKGMSIDSNEEKTVRFNYCQGNISENDIKGIEACALVTTRTERDCKKF